MAIKSSKVLEFSHSVKEIERTSQRIVVEETATMGAVVFFGLLALLTTTAFFSSAGIALGLFFASIAVYSGVRSLFIADRT